jgi:CelD/BcsL family acetyltransferase involved in cellulose biosynthesis
LQSGFGLIGIRELEVGVPVQDIMKHRQSQLEIVSQEPEFLALEHEWNALWNTANGRHHQRFDVCRIAWQQVAKPRGKRLHCIVVREAGELRLVWPLVTYRRLLWTYLVPLGPDCAEYTSVLTASGPAAGRYIEQAWRAALAQCGADFVHLEYVFEGSELHRIASREPRIVGRSRHEGWLARLTDEGDDWQAFCRSLGTLHGKKPGQLERRLAKEGALEIRIVEPSETQKMAECVRAMLSWKRQWSDRVNKRGKWLFEQHYENYLIGILTHEKPDARMRPLTRLVAVTLNAVPIAVAVMSDGNPVANAVISGFDPEYGKFGAGTIAWEHAVKWAFLNRFDIDFGVGSERFKTYWSRNTSAQAQTFQIANTTWGAIGHAIWSVVRDLRARLRGEPLSGSGADQSGKSLHQKPRG